MVEWWWIVLSVIGALAVGGVAVYLWLVSAMASAFRW